MTVNGNFKYKNLASALFFALLAIVVIGSMTVMFFHAALTPESSYYMGVSRAVMDGLVPYRDFALGITPLAFYLMAVPLDIFGYAFPIVLAFVFLIHILNSWLVWSICLKLGASRMMSALAAILSCLLCMSCEGCMYGPQPFAALAGLLALRLLTGDCRWKIMLSGLFCFVSFWCFQYGILFFVVYLIYLAFASSKKINILYLLLGFVIGAVATTLVLMVQKVSFGQLIQLMGLDFPVSGPLTLDGKMLVFEPLIPILIILIGLRRVKAFFLVLVAAVAYIPVNRSLSAIKTDMKFIQASQALYARDNIPVGSANVFASPSVMSLMSINEYIPPMVGKYGISNGFVNDPSKLMELLSNADYCMIGNGDFGNKDVYTGVVIEYLEIFFSMTEVRVSDDVPAVHLYTRNFPREE